MNVSFSEKQGPSWKQRISALALVFAGAFGAWGWHALHAPEHTSEMHILTADNADAAVTTERLLAVCLSDTKIRELADELAQQMIAAEKEESLLHRIFGLRLAHTEAAWRKLLQSRFQSGWLRDRVLRVALTYKAYGSPQQAVVLEKLYRLLEMEYAKSSAITVKQKSEARDAEVRKISEELSLLQTDPDQRALSQKTLAQMRSAVEQHAAPAAAWQKVWANTPELAPFVADTAQAWRAWQGACLQSEQRAARAGELAAWIASPQNQTVKQVVKRIVHYEDTPEMIRLKDRKAEVEAARTRLLQRATPLHPTAKKMSAEIDELNSQINALSRLPHTVEDVEERTNPQLVGWQRELAAARADWQDARTAEAAAKKHLLETISSLETADFSGQTLALQKARLALEKRRTALQEQQFTAAAQPFGLYLPPTVPVRTIPANSWLIYAIGLSLGGLGALAVLAGQREASFKYDEPPAPAPEYPVLGVIPDFRGKS